MKANKAREFLISMRYGRYNARRVGFKVSLMAEEELTERAVNVIRKMFPGEYEIIERFRNELEEEE